GEQPREATAPLLVRPPARGGLCRIRLAPVLAAPAQRTGAEDEGQDEQEQQDQSHHDRCDGVHRPPPVTVDATLGGSTGWGNVGNGSLAAVFVPQLTLAA